MLSLGSQLEERPTHLGVERPFRKNNCPLVTIPLFNHYKSLETAIEAGKIAKVCIKTSSKATYVPY